jgi:GNAT superfamily N-acetyltransferase
VNPGHDGASAQPAGVPAGPSLVIRARTEADLDECVSLLADVHRLDGYPMRWPDNPADWLTEPGLFAAWVATLDGRLAGHVAISRVEAGDPAADLFGDGAASVSRLFVGAVARGHGTGAALLQHVTREARQRGLRPVLEVLATAPAVAFYERLGWRLLGSVDRQWGPDHVVARCYAAPV